MKRAIIVFGSTGNLMFKKLIPALENLRIKKHLGNQDRIFAIGRKELNQDHYIQLAKSKVAESIDWYEINRLLDYVQLDVNKIEDYQSLASRLEKDGFQDVSVYLAVPPQLFTVISKGVSESGIINKGQSLKRIVFEKPFGEDLQSAKDINKTLWKYFDESQIYRIDHYLGKDMIQNILVLRFANKIFQNTWNKNTIQSVTILAKETEGIMTRGGYYDRIGALKDMLQSHLLQMASYIAISKPKSFHSSDIKNEKITVFNKFSFDEKAFLFGQYNGYNNTDLVDDSSNTETFVYAKGYIDNEKWQGVPFHFITGKKLDEKKSEIIIRFTDDSSLDTLWPQAKRNQNKLVIKVAPEDGVEFHLSIKEPGLEDKIIPASLEYCHSCYALQNTPEAYEKLLLDMINNHKTLFTRWDEIEKTWEIIEPIQKQSKDLFLYETYQDLKSKLMERGVNHEDL